MQELVVSTARNVAAADDANAALILVLDALRRSIGAPRAALLRVDGDQLIPVVAAGLTPGARKMDEASVPAAGEGAFPLMLRGRLEGVFLVSGLGSDVLVEQEDALLPLLDLAAVALRNARQEIEHDRAERLERERARLDGVLLAARTAQHRINNLLSLTVGMLDLLLADPRLPNDLQGVIDEAMRGAQDAADILHALQRLTRLDPVDVGGPGPVLRIDITVPATSDGLVAAPARQGNGRRA